VLGLCWWAAFTIVGVWAQHFLPGVDFLAPGLLVSLQEERPLGTAWLAVVWIMLQEGMGTLFFGASLLWYGVLVLGFLLGRTLFDPRSVTLMFLLGLLGGAAHFLVTFLVMGLEDMTFPMRRALIESVLQAGLLPALWFVAHQLFPERMKYDERAV
jgi:hypothetical protein